MTEPVYLDYNATTPVDKKVLEKMIPFFCESFGNAASVDHIYGLKAKEAVAKARENISKKLGGQKPNEIIFTSGATESNNMALVGVFNKYKHKGKHIISSKIEHPSVLDTLKNLKKAGAEITLVPVDKYGVIDTKYLEAAITEETILISIMFANNEIGTIQPIQEIGKIAKNKGILFHTDAAQAVGRLRINVYKLNVDLLSFCAHKFYGPKGTGGLFICSYSPNVKLSSIMFGGGHERELRSGTLNVPGIIGMSEALVLANKTLDEENNKLSKLSMKIFKRIQIAYPDVKINGHPQQKLVHNSNITIPGIEAKALIHILKDKLAFSTGSACSTIKVKPSHVLKSIGLDDEETFQTIRLSFGRYTKEDNIAEVLIGGIKKLKK